MRHLAALFLASALFVSIDCAHTPPIVNDVVTCGGHTVQPADVTEAYTDLTTQNWGDLAAMGVRLGWDIVACVIDDLTSSHPELKPAGEKFKSDHSEQIRRASAPSVSLRGPTLEKLPAFQTPTGEAMPAQAGNSGDARAPLAVDPAQGRTVSARAAGVPAAPVLQFPAAQTDQGEPASTPATSASPGKLTTPRPPAGGVGLAGAAAGRFTYVGETVSHAQASCEARCGSPDAVGSPGSSCLCWRGPRDARGGWVAIQ